MARQPRPEARQIPPQATLRELLDYNPESGALTWRVRPAHYFKSTGAATGWNEKYAGTAALNCPMVGGYLHGSLLGFRQYAHRVVWKWLYGDEPPQVDHDNGNKADNRQANLNAANPIINGRNMRYRGGTPSGNIGVAWSTNAGRWRAYLSANGKQKHLGYFPTIAAAKAARVKANKEFGFNPNHGRGSVA